MALAASAAPHARRCLACYKLCHKLCYTACYNHSAGVPANPACSTRGFDMTAAQYIMTHTRTGFLHVVYAAQRCGCPLHAQRRPGACSQPAARATPLLHTCNNCMCIVRNRSLCERPPRCTARARLTHHAHNQMHRRAQPRHTYKSTVHTPQDAHLHPLPFPASALYRLLANRLQLTLSTAQQPTAR